MKKANKNCYIMIKSIFAKSSGIGYKEVVKTFVACDNCVN